MTVQTHALHTAGYSKGATASTWAVTAATDSRLNLTEGADLIASLDQAAAAGGAAVSSFAPAAPSVVFVLARHA